MPVRAALRATAPSVLLTVLLAAGCAPGDGSGAPGPPPNRRASARSSSL